MKVDGIIVEVTKSDSLNNINFKFFPHIIRLAGLLLKAIEIGKKKSKKFAHLQYILQILAFSLVRLIIQQTTVVQASRPPY